MYFLVLFKNHNLSTAVSVSLVIELPFDWRIWLIFTYIVSGHFEDNTDKHWIEITNTNHKQRGFFAATIITSSSSSSKPGHYHTESVVIILPRMTICHIDKLFTAVIVFVVFLGIRTHRCVFYIWFFLSLSLSLLTRLALVFTSLSVYIIYAIYTHTHLYIYI